MNKEAVIVILDSNFTMNKELATGNPDRQLNPENGKGPDLNLLKGKQTRFNLAMEQVRMLLEQKVSQAGVIKSNVF